MVTKTSNVFLTADQKTNKGALVCRCTITCSRFRILCVFELTTLKFLSNFVSYFYVDKPAGHVAAKWCPKQRPTACDSTCWENWPGMVLHTVLTKAVLLPVYKPCLASLQRPISHKPSFCSFFVLFIFCISTTHASVCLLDVYMPPMPIC